MTKEQLIKMLNRALELEHSAAIQYLAHAEQIDGLNAEPLIARLQDTAKDEQKHAEMFRTLIGDYLGGVPSMGIAETHSAKSIKDILETNLKNEKEAVDFYRGILEKIHADKKDFPYEFLKLEHDVRHIMMEEQEHIAELKVLLAKR